MYLPHLFHVFPKITASYTTVRSLLFYRYVQWICRAEDLVLAEERTSEADRVKIMEARKKSAEKMKKLSSANKNDSVETNSMEDEEGERFN